MIVIRSDQAENYEPEKDWKRTSLCNQNDISIEHFVKPPNHSSPKHDHSNSQVLVVLKGRLAIITDDDEQVINEGDCVYIPGDESHIVKNLLDDVSFGLDIFVPGRSFDFWLNRNKK